jgi:hypothetical protein
MRFACLSLAVLLGCGAEAASAPPSRAPVIHTPRVAPAPPPAPAPEVERIAVHAETPLVRHRHLAFDGDDLLLAADGDGTTRLVRFSLARVDVVAQRDLSTPAGVWQTRLDVRRGLVRHAWVDGCLHTWEQGFSGDATAQTGRCAAGWLEDVDASGRFAALSSDGGELSVLDLASGVTVPLGKMRDAGVRSVRFDAAAEHLVVSSGQLWSRVLGRELGSYAAEYGGSYRRAEAALLSPSGGLLAVAGDLSVVVRDVESGDAMAYAEFPEPMSAWAFGPGGVLAAATEKGGLWRVGATGTRALRSDGETIVAITVSGDRAVTCDEAGLVELWDLVRGRRLGALAIFADGEWVAFSDDGRYRGTSGAATRLEVTPEEAVLVSDREHVARSLQGGKP